MREEQNKTGFIFLPNESIFRERCHHLSLDFLINYYQTALHFEAPEDIGTSKPFYDFTCKFMCQTVNHLLQAQKDFFDSFNPDEDNI